MKELAKLVVAVFSLFMILPYAGACFGQNPAMENDEGESVLVGRVAHVEGSVLRYVPEERDWVRTAKDSPFGLEDKLRSEDNGRAEIILPNNTWVRINAVTQVELVSLKNDETEMHMVYGKARFINKGSDSGILLTTSLGYVTAPGHTTFDVYVNDASVEVFPIRGTVYFTRDAEGTKSEVVVGSSSIVVDRYSVAVGQGYVDPSWDSWNSERDSLWAKRMRAGGRSAEYLPPSLADEAYVLEDYGVWERVYYDGAYGYFWRPIYATAGWAPFTVGRWTVWYGDHVWIPADPFGYVTHHYGNWVYIGHYWYWAPPVVSFNVRFAHPGLSIGFAWYPGRVAWIYSDFHIGWVPLAPHEYYYGHRRWGPRTVVVENVQVTHININQYTNLRHAVVVKDKDFYRVDDYKNYRTRDVDPKTVVNTYRVVPVVDHHIVNFQRDEERYSFTPTRPDEKRETGRSTKGTWSGPSGSKEEKPGTRGPQEIRGRSAPEKVSGGGYATKARESRELQPQVKQSDAKSQSRPAKGEETSNPDAVKKEGSPLPGAQKMKPEVPKQDGGRDSQRQKTAEKTKEVPPRLDGQKPEVNTPEGKFKGAVPQAMKEKGMNRETSIQRSPETPPVMKREAPKPGEVQSHNNRNRKQEPVQVSPGNEAWPKTSLPQRQDRAEQQGGKEGHSG